MARAMLQHLLVVELHLGVSARERSGNEQMDLIKTIQKTVITLFFPLESHFAGTENGKKFFTSLSHDQRPIVSLGHLFICRSN
jgi:hypothetical protein